MAFKNNTAVRFEGHGDYNRLQSIFNGKMREWNSGRRVSIQYIPLGGAQDGVRAYGVVRFPSTHLLPREDDMETGVGPGMTWWTFDTQFHGLTTLFGGNKAVTMDVFFIHGLNGHAFETWTSKKRGKCSWWNASPAEFITWIHDFLPGRLNDECRIMTYGFDANLLKRTKDPDVEYWAKHLLHELQEDRERLDITHERPIMFVAYSMGGLVARKAIEMLDSHRFTASPCTRFSRLAVPASGIAFLGTPHGGSRLAGTRLIASAANLWSNRTSRMLRMLQPRSTVMETNTRIWKDSLQWFCPFLCFVEEDKTPYPVIGWLRIVSRDSASFLDRFVVSLPNTNHRTICAYYRQSDDGFRVLLPCMVYLWGDVSCRENIEQGIAIYGALRTRRLPGHLER